MSFHPVEQVAAQKRANQVPDWMGGEEKAYTTERCSCMPGKPGQCGSDNPRGETYGYIRRIVGHGFADPFFHVHVSPVAAHVYVFMSGCIQPVLHGIILIS